MTVRKATLCDLERILEIYGAARAFMSQNGNPSQWGEIYPPREVVVEDIERGDLYAVCDGEHIVGVFAFFPYGDPFYDSIDGKWLSDAPHAAVHRVASSGERRGILRACMDYCSALSKNLKIDTHPNNAPMRARLAHLGFVECGRVMMPYGEEHIALQRIEN